MKKFNIVIFAAALFATVCSFTSCGAKVDEELYQETIGKKFEVTPPGNVRNLSAEVKSDKGQILLTWNNPTDKDFYGVTIKANPAFGTLSRPVTFMKDDKGTVPSSLLAKDLLGNVSYTFTVLTFDDNFNTTEGISVIARAIGENDSTSSNYYGSTSVFDYKKDKTAFDFGYCNTTTEKQIIVYASKTFDLSLTEIAASNTMGTSNFELVSCTSSNDPTAVELGDEVTITVRYTPDPVNPSWDERELMIGGDSESVITLIASNFEQPKNITHTEGGREYGLKLWLRSDLIGKNDIEVKDNTNYVTRLPDYSGRDLHAYSTSDKYCPTYDTNTNAGYNGLPFLNFAPSTETKKAQLLTLGNRNTPIIDSDKGSTTFVICNTDSSDTEKNTQSVISSNYGYSYPTLLNTYKYFDDNSDGNNDIYKYSTNRGWALRASALYGTYRYPCVSTNDGYDGNENPWILNKNIGKKASSFCLWFDMSMDYKAVEVSNSNYGWEYPSNIRMGVNGTERLLSYIYSSSKGTADSLTSGTNCYGAYGYPISDGKGHRYGTLKNYKTDSNSDKWKDSRTANVKRKNDWAFTYSAPEYRTTSETNYQYRDGSYASSDLDASNSYFTNWISNESRRNGTVYSLTVGADNTNGSTFAGKIAEVIMFDYPLSDAEIKKVNNYIYYRYKIGSVQ